LPQQTVKSKKMHVISHSRRSWSMVATMALVLGCSNASEQVATTSDPRPVIQGEPAKSTTILARFGSSHGMCVGYCTQEYELKPDCLTARRKGGGRGDPSTHPADQEQTVALDKAVIDTVMAKFDAAVFDAAPEVIGCPDCAGGGRCWVEVVRDGKPRTITFDCSTGSEQLKPLTDALWQLTEQVKWPEAAQEGQ